MLSVVWFMDARRVTSLSGIRPSGWGEYRSGRRTGPEHLAALLMDTIEKVHLLPEVPQRLAQRVGAGGNPHPASRTPLFGSAGTSIKHAPNKCDSTLPQSDATSTLQPFVHAQQKLQ